MPDFIYQPGKFTPYDEAPEAELQRKGQGQHRHLMTITLPKLEVAPLSFIEPGSFLVVFESPVGLKFSALAARVQTGEATPTERSSWAKEIAHLNFIDPGTAAIAERYLDHVATPGSTGTGLGPQEQEHLAMAIGKRVFPRDKVKAEAYALHVQGRLSDDQERQLIADIKGEYCLRSLELVSPGSLAR